MKKFLISIFAALAIFMLFPSCLFIRPYDKPEYVEVGTNETAFVIDLFANEAEDNSQAKVSAETTNYTKVNEKLVRIPHKWIKTGRLPSSGKWKARNIVVSVSNSPVTGTWDNDIKVETKGSQGFTVPMKYGIRVTPKDSELFLSKFPANVQIKDERGNSLSKKMTSVANVANDQFKNKVASELSREFHKYEYKDVLPNRDIIVDAAIERVKEWASEFGITVDTLAVYNGLIPDDPTLQNAMDEQAKLAAQVETEKKRQDAEKEKRNNELELLEIERQKVEKERTIKEAKARSTVSEQTILAQTSNVELSRKQKEQEIANLKLKGEAEAEAIKIRARALENIQLPKVVTSNDLKVLGLDNLISEATKQ